jgi:predicted XRE-type DNA-binding protein
LGRTRTRRALSLRRATSPRPLRSRRAGSRSPKYKLASQINCLLDEKRLSQLAAAERLGISQSKVSAIRNYKLQGISLGRLMEVLVALDQVVTIVVRSRTSAGELISVELQAKADRHT